jgi:hypothetical protein
MFEFGLSRTYQKKNLVKFELGSNSARFTSRESNLDRAYFYTYIFIRGRCYIYLTYFYTYILINVFIYKYIRAS